MPKSFRWQVAEPFAGAGDLARELRTSPLVAQMLHNRGIDTAPDAAAFLNPKLTDLHDPAELPGVAQAAKRIAQAIAAKEKIVIYGDYDVDGITAVAILHAALRLMNADVSFYVPHRLEEGYGLNVEAVQKIAAGGAKLMVTVDCGIGAVEPIAVAKAAGVETVVTDHHALPAQLPEAAAIVHPLLGGGPISELSGAGVAFKVAWQVAREVCGQARVDAPMREFLLDATCLAALGTIADVVPLVGENRVLATFGLRGLPQSRHPGMRALLESAGLVGEKLDAYHVGFSLAPRLNACGRMGHANLAVELLTDAPPQRCFEIAQYLTQQNQTRQNVEREIAQQAIEMALAGGADRPDQRAIVLASANWHGGVIGIVASRLVDRFGKPAILIALNGDGMGQGSGRSVPGFDLHKALVACGEHLQSFGGHAMAAGLRIAQDRIDAFRAAMLAHAATCLTDADTQPALAIDAVATLGMLDHNMVTHLEKMAPFGQGNAAPVLAFRDCQLVMAPRRLGRNGQTLSLSLSQNGATVRAVGFGMGDAVDLLAGVKKLDVAGRPVLNHFNGNTSIELHLQDIAWE